MKTSNNKPSSGSERHLNTESHLNIAHQLNKSPKPKESLSFATWVLLIISFTLLAYAIYTIQARVVL